MTDIYCDMDLTTGSANGTDWANAYQTFATGVSGSVAGDNLWVQGTDTVSATTTYNFQVTDLTNPVIVIGVKLGTTAQAPTSSDLIPGLRTGQVEIALDGGTDYGSIATTDTLTNTAQTGSATVDAISTVSAGSNPNMTITVTCTITGDWADNDTFTSHDSIAGDVFGDPITHAYNMTGTDAAPVVNSSGGTFNAEFDGFFTMYGVNFAIGGQVRLSDSGLKTNNFFEEVEFDYGLSATTSTFFIGGSNEIETGSVFKNCSFIGGTSASSDIKPSDHMNHYFYGCIFTWATDPTNLFDPVDEGTGALHFYGCSFSTGGVIVNVNVTSQADYFFANCQFGSGFSAITGTNTAPIRIRFHQCASTTGKTSGSEQNYIYVTEAGSIVEETTIVRTGGADDGANGGFSWACTPNTGDTIRNYYSLATEWMYVWVSIAAGSGASQTLTVYFCNDKTETSPTNDLHDDEVWLEVLYPSESGTAQHDFGTTQMQLLATPVDITDDTSGSTWHVDGHNEQKLTHTIAPDFEGPLYCRVHIATGDTTTVYIDPKLEIS